MSYLHQRQFNWRVARATGAACVKWLRHKHADTHSLTHFPVHALKISTPHVGGMRHRWESNNTTSKVWIGQSQMHVDHYFHVGCNKFKEIIYSTARVVWLRQSITVAWHWLWMITVINKSERGIINCAKPKTATGIFNANRSTDVLEWLFRIIMNCYAHANSIRWTENRMILFNDSLFISMLTFEKSCPFISLNNEAADTLCIPKQSKMHRTKRSRVNFVRHMHLWAMSRGCPHPNHNEPTLCGSKGWHTLHRARCTNVHESVWYSNWNAAMCGVRRFALVNTAQSHGATFKPMSHKTHTHTAYAKRRQIVKVKWRMHFMYFP